MPPVTVGIVSDAVCPWCFLGRAKLEIALSELPREIRDRVSIEWYPYQLNPTATRSSDRLGNLEKKFGKDKLVSMATEMKNLGKSVGIDFKFSPNKPTGNTMNAHRLIKKAHEYGLGDEMAKSLFELYFVEERDISSIDELANTGEKVLKEIDGWKKEEIFDFLNSDELAGSVDLEIIKKKREYGVRGVPHFAITVGDRTVASLSGSQEPSFLRAIISQAAAD